jgi:predicted Rossmann fold flavoprotein
VFKEAMLVTHRGVSGPAILQVSSYWRDGESVAIDLWPEGGLEPALQSGRDARREWIPLLAESWPRRWAELWVPREAPGKPLERCRNTDLAEFAERVHRWSFIPAGTEGYPKAEVTVGGVDTTELSPKTMEARSVRGLFFIGEVVDVTGWLGGYNFQWAWASARQRARLWQRASFPRSPQQHLIWVDALVSYPPHPRPADPWSSDRSHPVGHR